MLNESVLESWLCSSSLCPGGSIDGAPCSHLEEAEVDSKGPVGNAYKMEEQGIHRHILGTADDPVGTWIQDSL